MTLPDEALTLTGGCSCGAIRYRVEIPAAASRPLSPFVPESVGTKMPYALTCHCNDCRMASGTFLPATLMQIPETMIRVSVLPRTGSSETSNIITGRFLDCTKDDFDADAADAGRPPYLPASDVLRATQPQDSDKTWLRFFHSLDCGRSFSRSFCGRCGTEVCFHYALAADWCHGGKLPDGWSDVFDITTGSLDRKFVGVDWLAPDAETNFKHGSALGRSVSATGKWLKDTVKMKALGPEEGFVDEEELAELAKEGPSPELLKLMAGDNVTA
ncbi:unnamed protein product [Clonostachys rosea f. rosea IK726]|jgi:hypothetical protein|uniref:Uncharacterized protein n=1 Tax=Clonostachys rosea f. rosea IK726 TaxID=1349383 RepID=A0ACA9TTE3_BIOOC|nr:unnamed protein product [Clonostachys rosea f. rosea IK726]